MDPELPVVPDPEVLRHFWQLQRSRAHLAEAETYFGPTSLGAVQPPAWAWGATRSEADEFAARFLADRSAWLVTPAEEYPAGEEPAVGTISILCDGGGAPVALVSVEAVEVTEGLVREHLVVVKARA